MHQLESELAEDYPEARRRWEQKRAQAKALRAQWETDLKNSLKEDL
jgi:hypothetical protein